jgi:hypothetical protein
MVRHCVERRARAPTITLPRGGVLRPNATFARLTLGRDAADPALERDQVHDNEGKVPAHQAEEKHSIEKLRECPATDAAEGGDDEDHGKPGPGYEWVRGTHDSNARGEGNIESSTPRVYISQRACQMMFAALSTARFRF